MKKNSTEQRNASEVFCPNQHCSARGKVGQGNIESHGKKRPRYRCKTCGKTFSAEAGTMFEGLRKPKALIVIVVTLLAYGCPTQAIVHAFGLDERTVARWQKRAGKHCQQVHEAIVLQGQLDLVHVQADAHSGERAQNDCLDGPGDDGFDAIMAGRRRAGDT
jgi:transposase-like protein